MSENLSKIDYIIVLMLENRSFDHMLGYLKKEEGRDDIDGLSGDELNNYNNKSYKPYRLKKYSFEGDPRHDSESTEEQLKNNNGGFVKNYAEKVDKKTPGRIMGYHNAKDLPVFNSLAAQYCVCDRWFASIQGQTQPNRAYAISGTSDGHKDNIFKPDRPRFFKSKTVFHHLDSFGISWKYYSSDIAALRFNNHYKTSTGPIDKLWKFIEATRPNTDSTIPNVCWIDPDFGIFPNFKPANDDHPPHNVREGQRFVGHIYNRLLNAKNDLWKRTLFIVTYDEHGGFYDHVEPPKAEDERQDFRRYGVRVPAIIVSPWISKKSVSSVIFDHTSIIKTILLRFCQKPDGTIPNMGRRVEKAKNLGTLLTEQTPRIDCKPAPWVPLLDEFSSMAEIGHEIERPSDLKKDFLGLRSYCLCEGIMDGEL